MAEIYSAYYNANINTTSPTGATRSEQTNQLSGEVVTLRQQGCAPCLADNAANPPINERVPGGK